MKNILARIYMLLIVMQLSAVSALAQKMTVESFRENTIDMYAAATSTCRLDVNGNRCALVKVSLPLQGVEFEGGVVGDVLYKTGEYWVYMGERSTMLKIKHDNYHPLMVTFADYGINKVVSATTYDLVIQLPQGATTQVQEQTLTINFKPKNATVLVDSKLVKSSNGQAVVTLPVKSHDYIVAAEGYDSEEGTVKLKEASPTTINVELVKAATVSQPAQGTTTTVSAQVSTANGVSTAVNSSVSSSGTSRTHRGHEWVDLGLPSGTKWATTNVGANSPSDYGDYFAWGETSTKSNYDWENLKYCRDSSGNRFSKYVTDKRDASADGKEELEPSDDAAYVNWGEGWRMPSLEQIKELKEKCKWKWSKKEKGYKVVGPNGKFLFLPAAGYCSGSSSYDVGSRGDYWSRSLDTSYGLRAYGLNFSSDYCDWYDDLRRYGFAVRAVLAP